MRKASRAIVIHDDKLLVMHRNKFGTEYDTLPGGGVEIGEHPEQTVVREVFEETSIIVSSAKLVFIEEAGDPYGTQYVYLCEYVSGEPHLHEESEEMKINQLGQNLYEPRWVKLSDLPTRPFLSENLKGTLLQAIANGFPAEPTQIR